MRLHHTNEAFAKFADEKHWWVSKNIIFNRCGMTKQDGQAKANKNQNEKRKGEPSFSAVRLTDQATKDWLVAVIKSHGTTREAALIAAFKLLEKELKKGV